MFPSARFVHVVRDPRDIALSTNREQMRYIPFVPPQKYSDRDVVLKKIRLWFLLNYQVFKIAQHLHAPYLLLRIEDLVLGSPDVALAVIKNVWDFTGLRNVSQSRFLSDADLCCIEHQTSDFMGSFDLKKNRGLVEKMQATFLSTAKQGLDMFGYQTTYSPASQVASLLPTTNWNSICPTQSSRAEANNTECESWRRLPFSSIASISQAEGCTLHPRQVVIGSVLPYRVVSPIGEGEAANATDPVACCELCRRSRGCSVFEFVYPSRACKMVPLGTSKRTLRENIFATGGVNLKPIPSLPSDRITRARPTVRPKPHHVVKNRQKQ